MNIILTGMPASGKTTIAGVLPKKLYSYKNKYLQECRYNN